MKYEQLTVAELRAALEDAPHDALVSIEGCDCEAGAIGYSIVSNGVLIRRLDGSYDFNKAPFLLGSKKHTQ